MGKNAAMFQGVADIRCPHCKSTKTQTNVPKPRIWKNAKWTLKCAECKLPFDLHFTLRIDTIPTAEQLEEMRKVAEYAERKAEQKNGGEKLSPGDIDDAKNTAAANDSVSVGERECDECKGVGPHTHGAVSESERATSDSTSGQQGEPTSEDEPPRCG